MYNPKKTENIDNQNIFQVEHDFGISYPNAAIKFEETFNNFSTKMINWANEKVLKDEKKQLHIFKTIPENEGCI